MTSLLLVAFQERDGQAQMAANRYFYLPFSSGHEFDYCRRSHLGVIRGCSHVSALQGGNFRAGIGGALERHRLSEMRHAAGSRARIAHHF
jgi:hypothetical protein